MIRSDVAPIYMGKTGVQVCPGCGRLLWFEADGRLAPPVQVVRLLPGRCTGCGMLVHYHEGQRHWMGADGKVHRCRDAN